MKTHYLCLALLTTLWQTAYAIKGIDFQGAATVDTYTCLKNNGYNFVVLRATQANNTCNKYLLDNIIAARASGWEPTNVQLYLIPCPMVPAKTQVQMLFDALKNSD